MEKAKAEQYENTEGEDYSRLDSLAQALVQKRKEAIEFRAGQGIETAWEEDKNFYDGDETYATKFEKPATSDGRVRVQESSDKKFFVNITRPYVDMAASRAADMLFPNDDQPFDLDPTPIPEIDDYEDSEELMTFPDGTEAPAKDVVRMIREKAQEIAERSKLRIWDWLVESGWHMEGRRLITDAAKIGTGVIKGPIPEYKSVKKVKRDETTGGVTISIEQVIKPTSKRISVENLYPDPACGENIHNGSYIWEKDCLSKKQLMDLLGKDYLDDQILKCLKAGPESYGEPDEEGKTKNTYDLWIFHGLIEAEDLAAAGCECGDEEYDGSKTIPAIITMVNDKVIKAAVSPLDSGEFPYDVIPWERIDGYWAGRGVARQIRTPQRILNAATKKMLDNAAMSSDPIVFLRKAGIEPADGKWEITPGKIFFVDDEAERKVGDALYFSNIPNNQKAFESIVQYALDLAERVTNMPLIMQGQQGLASETVGGMQLLQNNASSVLRMIAKNFDAMTTSHVSRHYEWLLLYGDDEEEKGDSSIVAKGSTTFYERDAYNQAILQMAAIVKDPAFEINPAKWSTEALKAQKIDPSTIKYTKEELEQMAQAMQQQQPAQDPRIAGQLEIAQTRVQGELEKATLVQQSDMAELQLKQAIEQAKLDFQAQQAQAQREHEQLMKQMDFQMKTMEFAQQRQLQLDDVKAQLAGITMKLATQKELSAAKTPAPQVATPMIEPAGRAPAGEAFQK